MLILALCDLAGTISHQRYRHASPFPIYDVYTIHNPIDKNGYDGRLRSLYRVIAAIVFAFLALTM